MSVSLRALTLGVALADVSHEVREVGGNNRGPRVAWYLANVVPPLAPGAPWCAAAVQGWSDIAARALRVPNPLDGVRREALVMDYLVWASARELVVPASEAEPGDLVLFDFQEGGRPWDHIGLVLDAPGLGGGFRTVEGNTGSDSQRDGDGVYVKGRSVANGYPTAFVRWAE